MVVPLARRDGTRAEGMARRGADDSVKARATNGAARLEGSATHLEDARWPESARVESRERMKAVSKGACRR